MAIKGARPEDGRVTAHRLVRGAEQTVEFYKRAFGATELYRSPMPDGNGIHAKVRIAKSVVLISDERPVASGGPGVSLHSPHTLGGGSTVLELYVDDADAAYQRAVSAGATPTLPCRASSGANGTGGSPIPSGTS